MAKKAKLPLSQYRREIKEGGNVVTSVRPLFTTWRFLTSATISTGNSVKLFQKGVQDDLINFGYGSGAGAANESHTNLLQNGRLQPGSLFEVKAIELVFPYDVAIADLRGLANFQVSWVEGGGTERLILGQVEDFPQKSGIVFTQSESATPASAGITTSSVNVTRSQTRFSGALYSIGGETLFDIRGNVEDHNMGYLEVQNFGSAYTPSAQFDLKAKFHGVYHQVVGNS